ncbi:MAG TPA: hypothetical protein VNJ12_06690 [Candidatus Dormibacteraeota bacterium]|nr:hypothetical protein [Candidatus Dormibacteraeota bacterium]
MNGKIRAFWRWLTTARPDTEAGAHRQNRFPIWRHTAWLEGEIERLRAECAEARRQNWALVNSLVTTAGAPLPQEMLRSAGAASSGLGGQGASPDRSRAEAGASAPEAHRAPRGRKSWHQVSRALEIESARPPRPAASGPKGA